MRHLLLAGLLALVLLPGIAHADLIPDNYHVIEQCLSIENLSAYPDVDFVLSEEYRFQTSIKVLAGENCGLGGRVSLLAIKKSDWNKVQHSPEGSETDGWSFLPANASLIRASSLAFSLDTRVPDTDPATKKNLIVHVDTVTDQGVQAHLVATEIVKKDGSRKTVLEDAAPTTPDATAKTQPAASPEEGGQSPSSPTALIAVIVIGLLGLGLAYRAWKK